MPQGRADKERLTDDNIELADQFGRYGYRIVTGLLNTADWRVNPQAGRADLATRRAKGFAKAEECACERHWFGSLGEREGSRCTTGAACAYGLNGRTMSNHTTSFGIGPLMGGSIEHR